MKNYMECYDITDIPFVEEGITQTIKIITSWEEELVKARNMSKGWRKNSKVNMILLKIKNRKYSLKERQERLQYLLDKQAKQNCIFLQ